MQEGWQSSTFKHIEVLMLIKYESKKKLSYVPTLRKSPPSIVKWIAELLNHTAYKKNELIHAHWMSHFEAR